MDSRNEIRDFLISRRAKITPEQAGLPAYGGNRRVYGLRREEVAMVTGVSVDYYLRVGRAPARVLCQSFCGHLPRAPTPGGARPPPLTPPRRRAKQRPPPAPPRQA